MGQPIKCPKCGNPFDVEDVISADLEQKIQREYQEKLNESLSQMETEKAELKRQQEDFLQKKNRENELFSQRVQDEKMKIETQLRTELSERIGADYELKLKNLEDANEKKNLELQEVRKQQLQLIRQEEALRDRELSLELEVSRKLQAERNDLQERIRQQEREVQKGREEDLQMRLKEMEKQLDDQKKLADAMKRKAEQGSMQLQGEVQELALEELLRSQFPFDKVEEVGKGVRGADCILTVRNAIGQECGKIIFESKRTENFGGEWIEKLKHDMLTQSADIAVIVTRTMPRDMEQFGEKNGVYICSFGEVRSLTLVLRNAILKIAETRKTQENKGEKMESLYHYLTGQEFMGNWNAMREGFRNLRSLLQREREDFEKNWKKKEKQIDLIIQNSLQISGSIEGIAGQESFDLEIGRAPEESLPEKPDGSGAETAAN